MDKKEVEGWIFEHYRRNPKVLEMAKKFSYSICHFQREFKSEFGVSPKQFIMNLRLEEARRLIETHGYQSDWLWMSLGFCAQSKFSRQFKRRFGVSPVEYRKRVWRAGTKM